MLWKLSGDDWVYVAQFEDIFCIANAPTLLIQYKYLFQGVCVAALKVDIINKLRNM